MIYFSKEDLKLKIDENREMISFLEVRIQEFTDWFHALEGKTDCVVDNKGKVMGRKQKISTYSIIKAKQENRAEYQKKLYKTRGVEMPWERS